MRLRRIYGAPVAAVSMSVEGETAAYAAAVVANGGTVSDARVAILNTFIRTEKASGAWALTDDYWGLWAEGEAQALTSLKQRRLATAVASPTFTADRGYAFNGTTQYVDTGFIPLTHAVAMGTNSVHIEAYERTNVTANTTAAGAATNGTISLQVRPRSGTTSSGFANAQITTFSLPSADSRGLTQIGRAGSAVGDVYGAKNGVDLSVSVVSGGVGASLPGFALYIGGNNVAGTLTTPRACSVGFVSCGAALTEAQRLARYNAVQAWATSVGANV